MPVGVVLLFLVMALIREQPVARDKKGRAPVDWMGFGFVALSLGCLQVVLDRGQEDDWFGSP